MTKFIEKAKATLNIVLAFLLMLPMAITKPIYADEGDPSIKNPDGPTIIEDSGQQIKLYKTVKSVEGYANKWEVTLRIESPKTEKTSDTVLVIDRSGSMSDNGRMASAKSAANSLAEQLLPSGNTTNRVALVSFATSATTGADFTTDYSTISSRINSLSSRGGTFTQSAIRMAADLLSTSTADIKTIILLSDGEPTYSYPFTREARGDDDNFVRYGNALETSSEVDQSVFSYSATGSVGNGSSLRECMEYSGLRCVKYYNNGNSAIAEAGYFKAKNDGLLYTIALEAEDGTPILQAMASPGKAYEATPDELTKIFKEIGGNILSLIQEASVEDTMGHGVTVSGSNDTTIEWEPEFELQGDVFVAEKTYEVEMDESVFEQTPDGGYYALNDSAVLTYNDGKTGEFPVPKAKPFSINVEKEFVTIDSDGQEEEVHDEEFKFRITGNSQEYTGSILSGEHNTIPVPMPIKLGTEYKLEELAWVPEDSDAEFENYKVEYFVGDEATDTIVITQNHGDFIDTKIKNTYETVDIDASKTWEDDGDRDGLRDNYSLSAALKANGEFIDVQEITGADTQEFTFEDLPKYYNNQEIEYEVVEAECSGQDETLSCEEFAGDDDYTVETTGSVANGFEITNTHEPETKDLVIKKIWKIGEEDRPSVTPEFVTVELSNSENSDVETVILKGSSYSEWESTPITVNVYHNHGEEIVYEVKETTIGPDNLIGDNKDTLYVYNGQILEGKWTAENSDLEVTNTWTPAKPAYEGETEFTIKKVDQDGEALDGVTFTVNGTKYTTADGGIITIPIESTESAEDELTFTIEETDTLDDYELIEGTEELAVTSTSTFDHADETTLTNYYIKAYTFEPTEIDGYVWEDESHEYTITNQGLGKNITIIKTFEGISADLLSDLTFTVTGPEGFEEQEIGFDEFEVSGNTATYELDGYLPVGEYTVTESNAEVDNFDLVEVTGDDGEAKTVELGGEVEFTINNIYDVIKDIEYRVKKVWEDVDDQDGKRPETLSVTLLQNGEEYDTVELNADDDWAYAWTELPRVDEEGVEYVYTAEEASVDDYESNEGEMKDGIFTFTNSHTPETVIVKVDKSWEDDNNRDGLRNDDSTVRFCVTGYTEDYTSTPECKTVLTGLGAKTDIVTFENLPKYHKGVEINYEVTEVEVLDGYTSDLVPGEYVVIIDGEGTKEVTNTHEPEKISFLIQKVWDDEDDKDGIRPTEITVNVTGGEEDISLTITEEDFVDGKCESWCAEVAELYKYRNGSEIEYSVDEEEVADYETKITGSVEDGFTITNTHTSEPEPEPEPEPDPCADGGCGGEDITPITPITPETGRITLQKRSNAESSWINNFICITIVTLVSTGIFAFKKYKEKQLTK